MRSFTRMRSFGRKLRSPINPPPQIPTAPPAGSAREGLPAHGAARDQGRVREYNMAGPTQHQRCAPIRQRPAAVAHRNGAGLEFDLLLKPRGAIEQCLDVVQVVASVVPQNSLGFACSLKVAVHRSVAEETLEPCKLEEQLNR